MSINWYKCCRIVFVVYWLQWLIGLVLLGISYALELCSFDNSFYFSKIVHPYNSFVQLFSTIPLVPLVALIAIISNMKSKKYKEIIKVFMLLSLTTILWIMYIGLYITFTGGV